MLWMSSWHVKDEVFLLLEVSFLFPSFMWLANISFSLSCDAFRLLFERCKFQPSPTRGGLRVWPWDPTLGRHRVWPYVLSAITQEALAFQNVSVASSGLLGIGVESVLVSEANFTWQHASSALDSRVRPVPYVCFLPATNLCESKFGDIEDLILHCRQKIQARATNLHRTPEIGFKDLVFSHFV